MIRLRLLRSLAALPVTMALASCSAVRPPSRFPVALPSKPPASWNGLQVTSAAEATEVPDAIRTAMSIRVWEFDVAAPDADHFVSCDLKAVHGTKTTVVNGIGVGQPGGKSTWHVVIAAYPEGPSWQQAARMKTFISFGSAPQVAEADNPLNGVQAVVLGCTVESDGTFRLLAGCSKRAAVDIDRGLYLKLATWKPRHVPK